MAGKLGGCSQLADEDNMSAPLHIWRDDNTRQALAQLSAFGSGPKGRRFESSRPDALGPQSWDPSLSASRHTDDFTVGPVSEPLVLDRGRHTPRARRERANLSRCDNQTARGLSVDASARAGLVEFDSRNPWAESSDANEDCSAIGGPTDRNHHTMRLRCVGGQHAQKQQTKTPTVAQCARLLLQTERANADRKATRALKRQTLRSMESYAKHLGCLATVPIGDIRPRDVSRWHANLVDVTGLAPKTADTILSFLSTIWNWARLEGWVEGRNPCEGQRKFGRTRRTQAIPARRMAEWRMCVTTAEREAVDRWRTPERKIVGRAPYILFRLVPLTGARPSELRTARWSDIDGDVIIRGTSKTGVPRRIVLIDAAKRELAAWRDLLNTSDETRNLEHIFPAVRDFKKPLGDYRKAWARVCKHYGDPELWLYDGRRTFAIEALRGGADVNAVAAAMGNSPDVVRDHYAGHVHDPAAVRAAEAAGRRFKGGDR